MKKINVDPYTRSFDMYTPQQIAGFERALEKARTEKARYQAKLENCNETITGFENLLKEIKKR